MFNKDFYPTPPNIISKMLEGERLYNKKILESSAGKGDILDYIQKNKLSDRFGNYSKSNLYAIEIEPELQAILRDKEYNLVHDNFITYNPDYFFDYIIMNPPFSNGAEHLLKAIEISNGAKIICLLNSETYNNPYTKERQLLKQIIDEYGTVEELGQCFKDSERSTNVNVILIKLQKEPVGSYFKFEGEKEQQDFIEIEKSNNIAVKDNFGNFEIYYEKCKETVKEILTLQEKLRYYGGGLDTNAVDILKNSIDSDSQETYNKFLEKLRYDAWKYVIKSTKVSELVTTKVRNDFFKTQDQQGFMAYTKENMQRFFQDLFYNQGQIAQNCVEEAFDIMTKYHKENRIYVDGWKTNDRWKVGKKFILPRMLSEWSFPNLESSKKDILDDIEKGMCFITKKSFNNIKSLRSLYSEYNKVCIKFNYWYDSEFFEFKVFKKGTMHLKFKDEWLYQEFNSVACKNKNWLGIDK